MTGKPMSFDVVRELARTLPDIEETTGHGAPALKARGKLMVCPAIHKSAEPHSLVVKVSFDQRTKLIAADPNVYYLTDHYMNYPSVLVRMSEIDRDSLRRLLENAWEFVCNESKVKKQKARKASAPRKFSR